MFFIVNPSKDIKREGSGGIKQWISRSQKHLYLTAERASKSLIDLANGRHALVLKDSGYINEDIFLFTNHPGSRGFICITFRASRGHEELQTLLSNFQTSSENLQPTQKSIYGEKKNGKTKCVTIHHAAHNWTTLFIEYLGAYPQTHGSYIINNDRKLTGSFTLDSSDEMSSGFSVGSRYDNFLQGEIASIEIYHGKGKKTNSPSCQRPCNQDSTH